MYITIIHGCTIVCHGNGSISHSPTSFFLGDKKFRIYLIPVNNLVSIKKSPGDVRKVLLAADLNRIQYFIE